MPNADIAQPADFESQTQARKDALTVALAWRKIIWRQAARDENERIDRFVEVCVRLCDGDRAAGEDLATTAIWSPR